MANLRCLAAPIELQRALYQSHNTIYMHTLYLHTFPHLGRAWQRSRRLASDAKGLFCMF